MWKVPLAAAEGVVMMAMMPEGRGQWTENSGQRTENREQGLNCGSCSVERR